MPVFPLVAAGSKSGRADRAELEMCSAPSSLYAIGGVELELVAIATGGDCGAHKASLQPMGGDQVMVRGTPRHVVGYLKDFNFDVDQIRSPIATLSGGERNRLLLAKLLARPSDLLVLDEPTSMLDPLHQHTTLQAVREFANRGGAVMVILHDLNLAARYCDRLLLLESGRPYAFGSPEEVLVPDALKAVFGLEVLVQRHPERGHPLIIAR